MLLKQQIEVLEDEELLLRENFVLYFFSKRKVNLIVVDLMVNLKFVKLKLLQFVQVINHCDLLFFEVVLAEEFFRFVL